MKQYRKKEVKEKQQHPLDRFLFQGKFPKTLTKLDVVALLNFCSLNVSDDEKLKWIREFLNNSSFFNKDASVLQKGGVAYLLMKGYEIENFNPDKFSILLSSLNSKLVVKKEIQEKVELSEEDKERLKESKQQLALNEFLGKVDCIIDHITQNPRYSPAEELNAFSPFFNAVNEDESLQRLKKELLLRLNSPISDAAEQYGQLSNAQVKKILTFLDSFQTPILIKKETSHPRERRRGITPPSSQLKRFKVCKEFQGITAIPSIKVIGAKTLLVFNTEKHTLTVVKALRGKPLDIYRTAIINIDQEKTKTIKLPWSSDKEGVALLQTCLLGKQREIEERLDTIPTIKYRFSGRCSEKTIILAYF